MSKRISITSEIDLESIAEQVVDCADRDKLIEFIKLIDTRIADLAFTRELATHFVAEVKRETDEPSAGNRVHWTVRHMPHVGTIVRVLQPGERPPYREIREPGAARDHVSYLVRDDHGTMYWPRVKGLEVLP